jgi:16S rRNA (uracil1498-N3)-methyltransferase
VGDIVRLNSGFGLLAEAEIVQIDKHEVRLKIMEITDACNTPDFALAFSLLKGKHDELIIEKVTELGAQRFFPMITEFSVRQQSKNTIERFHRICLSAIKQCDNPWLPVVSNIMTLEEALKKALDFGYKPLICSERKPQSWLLHSVPDSSVNPCFFIGPEGGWSLQEFELFDRMKLNEISISDLTLRAETAAITVAAQWSMLKKSLP